jgi:hypothetical protein
MAKRSEFCRAAALARGKLPPRPANFATGAHRQRTPLWLSRPEQQADAMLHARG